MDYYNLIPFLKVEI